jgi:glycosyltransferase involved in cell wall biosynthesis
MKILLWAPFGAGTHYWGPGTSAFRLYKSLNDKNIKVTLIHASDEQEFFKDVFIEQIKLPTLKKNGLIDKIRYFRSAMKWIKENHQNYDVVHGITAFEYTFRPLLQFSKYGVPVFIKITGEHGGFGENSILSKFLGIAKRRKENANKITGYISISSSIEANLLKNGIKEEIIHSIPNGVDINRFKPINRENKIALRSNLFVNNIFTFIYLGGLTHNKRIIEIVTAVGILKSKGYNNFQLLIVGPDRSGGVVENEINSIIQENKLNEQIIRFDKVEQPELFFQVADVFMLVSKKEGLSNSLLEAMATALGTIVTNISGSTDLVKNNVNGFYTNGIPVDIADKMLKCMNEVNTIGNFGKRNREKIVNEYSNETLLKKHIQLFKRNINK